MDFRVLGPGEGRRQNGAAIAVTQTRRRAALCVLLLHAGQPLTLADLSDLLWGSKPPGNPAGALRSCVYALRKAVGLNDRLRTHATGYVLDLCDGDRLDLLQFRGLLNQAETARPRADDATTAMLLQQALDLWREPPLADLPATQAAEPLLVEALQLRRSAQEILLDTRLALGHHLELVPALMALTSGEPLHERHWERLMLALYRCGRQAEALAAYARARAILAEECGIDPGPGLQELQRRILAADPSLVPETGDNAEGVLCPYREKIDLPSSGRGEFSAPQVQLFSGERLVSLSGAPYEPDKMELVSQKRQASGERIALLFDEGSFSEVGGLLHSNGLITGWGTVNGRTVFACVQDFTASCGLLAATAQKIDNIIDMALAARAPLVSFNEGTGDSSQEKATELISYAAVLQGHIRASGVIPQISVTFGAWPEEATYFPALTDFVFAVHQARRHSMYGLAAVQDVTHEKNTRGWTGGANGHTEPSNVCHFVYADEGSCLRDVRYLLSLLPANYLELPPCRSVGDPLDRYCEALSHMTQDRKDQPYDLRRVIKELADQGEYLEVQEQWAPRVICALARLDGHTVAFVANQLLSFTNVMDIRACEKAARFIQICDAFNVPLVTLLDMTGDSLDTGQRHSDTAWYGAKLIYAYCGATVPKIQLMLRATPACACPVITSCSAGADLSFAWPITPRSRRSSCATQHRPVVTAGRKTAEAHLAREQRARPLRYCRGIGRGWADEIINPAETRTVLARSLAMLRTKRTDMPARKHGNPPI